MSDGRGRALFIVAAPPTDTDADSAGEPNEEDEAGEAGGGTPEEGDTPGEVDITATQREREKKSSVLHTHIDMRLVLAWVILLESHRPVGRSVGWSLSSKAS